MSRQQREVYHARIATRDGFENETFNLGSLDGGDVTITLTIDEDDILHLIVFDTISEDWDG